MLPRNPLLTLVLGLALAFGARPAGSNESDVSRATSERAPETPGAGLAETTPETPDPRATLEQRVAELEAQMETVNRKFRLLGSDDAGFTDALESPTFLYEKAEAIVGSAPLSRLSLDDHMRAYRYLALSHQLHPDGPDDDQAFLLAALLFKRLWFSVRFTQPDSIWHVSEPYFMFQWLTDFFEPDAPFPRAYVGTLLAGLPSSFYRKFEVFAQEYERPESLKRWRLVAEDDNGIVQVVTGELRAEPEPGS